MADQEWDIERLRRIYDTPSVAEIAPEDAMYLAAYLQNVNSFDIFDNRDASDAS
jgi:hypothetical protein